MVVEDQRQNDKGVVFRITAEYCGSQGQTEGQGFMGTHKEGGNPVATVKACCPSETVNQHQDQSVQNREKYQGAGEELEAGGLQYCF